MKHHSSLVYFVGGLSLVGIGCIKYFVHRRYLSLCTAKLQEEEDKGMQRAQRILLASPYFGDLENLRKIIDGQVVLPMDREKYQACRRRAFNKSALGFPCVIVRVQNTKDIVACVKFVNKHRSDINLCIASGCHSSKCMMDFAFVIDLCQLKNVEVDPTNLLVKIDGGVLIGEIDKALKPHNLALPIGTYPLTGVGGLSLGGGFGFLSRTFGFAADNLIEAEVVLHNGEVLVTNDTQHSDLIWGLRGGSGNFGIVTKFTFRIHNLPTYCLSGTIMYLTPTLHSAATVACNADKLIGELPNNMSAMMVLVGGVPVTPTIWANFGEEKTIKQVPWLQKATKLGGWLKLKNDVRPCSYHSDLQTVTMSVVEKGNIYHTLIQFGEVGKDLPREFWEKLLTHTRAKLHPSLRDAALVAFPMGGVMAQEQVPTCIAKSTRRAKYFAVIEVYWRSEFGNEGRNAAREWGIKAAEIIKPYVNENLRYAPSEEPPKEDAKNLIERDHAGYGADSYPQLQALKKKYDPSNLFKNNLNISPA